MKRDFKITFNKNQWINVYLEEECQDWGGFLPTWKNPEKGVFGKLTLSTQAKQDTIVHEVFHIVMEHMRANRKSSFKYEEDYASLSDELFTKIEEKVRNEQKKK